MMWIITYDFAYIHLTVWQNVIQLMCPKYMFIHLCSNNTIFWFKYNVDNRLETILTQIRVLYLVLFVRCKIVKPDQMIVSNEMNRLSALMQFSIELPDELLSTERNCKTPAQNENLQYQEKDWNKQFYACW